MLNRYTQSFLGLFEQSTKGEYVKLVDVREIYFLKTTHEELVKDILLCRDNNYIAKEAHDLVVDQVVAGSARLDKKHKILLKKYGVLLTQQTPTAKRSFLFMNCLWLSLTLTIIIGNYFL